MDFRKSLIVSAGIHIAAILFLPAFRFARIKTDWIEVSIATFPDLQKTIPDWHPGRRLPPVPSKEDIAVEKDQLPLPVSDADTGIPVKSESPDLEEAREKDFTRDAFDMDFEKVVPGVMERKGAADEAGESSSFQISGPVTIRKLLRKVYPKYPIWAEEKGVEGEVDLRFWVSPEGMVFSVEILKTSGYPDLDSRAMEAVKKYLFSPLGKDEEQKEQWGTITIKYTLK